MKLEEGAAVVSLAGHDRGRCFFVVGKEEGYLLVADGRARKIEKPKRKKVRHIRVVGFPEGAVAEKLRRGEKVCNRELWMGVREFKEHSRSGHEEVASWQKKM